MRASLPVFPVSPWSILPPPYPLCSPCPCGQSSVHGAPWMRPEERKVAIEFLRDTLKHYKKSGVAITPMLSYHLENAMTYIAHLHRLEHQNVPQNDPQMTPG